MDISILKDQILTSIEKGIFNEELIFETENKVYKMYHENDCCESVSIEEIIGELKDLIGSPILTAEERAENNPNASDSGTWTFYELATINGSVTIRWYGSSNGYYSESVNFEEIK